MRCYRFANLSPLAAKVKRAAQHFALGPAKLAQSEVNQLGVFKVLLILQGVIGRLGQLL